MTTHNDPVIEASEQATFRSDSYMRINARRLEHLASLALPLRNARVLELGAGVGDLTSFFLDRDCSVLSLEGREENATCYRQQFASDPRASITVADLNDPPALSERFDIVFCYGLLYHLAEPHRCLRWMTEHCDGMIALSSCVTAGDSSEINPTQENAEFASQALDGRACRPSRRWIYDTLGAHMEYVYTTHTQPAHDEFPLDWSSPTPSHTGLHRAIFIASRTPIENEALHDGLLQTHEPMA